MSKEVIRKIISLIFLFLILPILSNETNLTEINEEININEIFIQIEGRNSKFLNENFNEVPTQVLLNDEEYDFQNLEIQSGSLRYSF